MGMFLDEGEDLTQKGFSMFLNKLNYLLCFSNRVILKKVEKFSSQATSLNETILCYTLKNVILFYLIL